MRSLRILVLAFVVVLAACGSSGSKSKTTGTTAASSSATTAATSGAAIATGKTSLGTVLVNAEGKTLYHFTKDTATTIACVDKCAVTWPPATVPTGQQPQSGGQGITGSLTVVTRPDGTKQYAINGQPLYTFSGDTKAGDTNGQGFGGLWFAVLANGSSATGGATGNTTATTSTPATTSGTVGGGY